MQKIQARRTTELLIDERRPQLASSVEALFQRHTSSTMKEKRKQGMTMERLCFVGLVGTLFHTRAAAQLVDPNPSTVDCSEGGRGYDRGV